MLNGAVKKKSAAARRENWFSWLVLAPALLYYFIFFSIPLIMVVIFSLFKWDGIYFKDMQWRGFTYYGRFFTDSYYYMSLLNTLLIGVILVAFGMAFGFLIALLMAKKLPGMTAYRAIWYIPCVVSMAIMSQLINVLLNPLDGAINIMLQKVGGKSVLWQNSAPWMFFWIILISIWRGLGGTIILFVAGLKSIPVEMYEAAAIDGVNAWQRLTRITLPLMRQMVAFVLITGMIGIFGIFEAVQLISKGGPAGATKVVMYQIYDEAFVNNNMGMSSAISVIVLIIVFAITAVNMKLTKLNV